MTVNCTWAFHVSSAESTSNIAAEVESVMEHLLALEEGDERLTDSAVGLDLDQMVVEISISVQCGSFEDGLTVAMAAIRTAIHASGGSTPEWPSIDQFMPHPHEDRDEDGLIFQRGELVAC